MRLKTDITVLVLYACAVACSTTQQSVRAPSVKAQKPASEPASPSVCSKEAPLACTTSPDGKSTVCAIGYGCEDYCHYGVFLVQGSTTTPLGQDVDGVRLSWNPVAPELAVEVDSVTVVNLTTLELRHLRGLSAPSYAPNGALYARSDDGDYYVVRGSEAELVHAASAESKAAIREAFDYRPVLTPTAFDSTGRPLFLEYAEPESPRANQTDVDLYCEKWYP